MFLVLGIVNELLRNRISHGANRFGLVIVSAVLKLETTTRLLFVSLSTCNQILYTRIGVIFYLVIFVVGNWNILQRIDREKSVNFIL